MHTYIYTRARCALVVVAGILALFAFVQFTQAQGLGAGVVEIADVTVSGIEDNSVTVSFSLLSSTAREDVRYGIGVYSDLGNGSVTFVDAVSADETLSLAANEPVSRALTYIPPEQLLGQYALMLVVRSADDTILGEYALQQYSFAPGDLSTSVEVASCDFSMMGSSDTIECTLTNTNTSPQTVNASMTLRKGGIFGEAVGASLQQSITIPASESEQMRFSGFPTNLARGSYTIELSFFEGDILLSRQMSAVEEGILSTTAAPEDAEDDMDAASARSTTLYAGALVLALLLLLGLLVFSRKRTRIMMLALLAGTGLLISAPFAWAQETSDPAVAEEEETTNMLEGTVFDSAGPAGLSCFDYYDFGSVQVIASPQEVPPAGFPLTFKGEIINGNEYPVVDAQVYAKVFRTDKGGNIQRNGYALVDFFLVKDGLALPASSTTPLEFSWKIPEAFEPGDYRLAFFVTSAHRYNMLGLSFTDDVIGNVTSFSVTRGPATQPPPAFNKDGVTLDGDPYFFASFPPHFPEDHAVTVVTPLMNPGSEPRAVTVTWKLYSWDGLREETLLDTKTETLAIGPGETVPLTYVGEPHGNTVSYLLIDAAYGDAHSLLNVRYVHDGKEEARINFPAVTQYPLTEGVEQTVFSCLHAMNPEGTEGELTLKLTTPAGREIASATFPGRISGAMMAHLFHFTPSRTYSDFDLVATLVQNGEVIESVTQHYRCEDLMPGQCPRPFPWLLVSTLTLIGLGLLTLFFLRRKRGAGSGETLKQPTDDIIGPNSTI